MIKTVEKYEILETIYCSSSSIVFQAYNTKTKEKLMIKTLNKGLYDMISLSKLKNEYKLLKKVQSEYVVKAYEFSNVENRFSIVIEDFGGISLAQYIKTKQIDLKEFLEIALEITQCLEHIHKNQVIHKDINPSNIIYNPDTKVIKMIDFGISSDFSFETMQVLNPNRLEGTLSYISPEQTGRMNLPVDYRTDFYSLGVTLYELACNKLPFYSADPAEMIHFHIAMTSQPAHEINHMIPQAISAIISKLMSKIPEERYKSATGIIFDLKKCIQELEKNRIIEEYALGGEDISDKFEIPKELYGREDELTSLLTAFENTRKGKAEFILIGGYSGIGKTSLVNELHKPIIKEHGMFLTGKFDQYTKNTPYAAVIQAINQFCNYILSEPEREIERWKKRIIETVGANGRLISEVVPRLELIIGEQAALEELSSIEEQNRFKIALKNWLLTISAPEHPVVFFMDDVHWADMASLELFESILLDPDIKGLMFIGTYRDNEVDASHPLIMSIEKVKKNNGKIELMKLGNLDILAIAQMIADTVKRPEAEVLELAWAVNEKTLGNPFYTIELLKYCNKEKLIYYDYSEISWEWDESEIRSRKIEDNVADYLIGKTEDLPAATKELVSIAACLGNNFDLRVLAAVAGIDPESIAEKLKPAISEEMIYVSGKKEGNFEELQFKFCHDRFQQAGYQVLAEDIRKTVHLNIARYYENIEGVDGNSYLFIVAEHYSKALDGLVSTEETEKVIETFFKAAHAASLSSAFDTARQYLEIIMDIAPEQLKKNDSFLLRIYTEYHLVLFSLARFEELDKTFTKVEEISKDPLDLVDCCCLQLISLSNRSRYKEGFLLGAALLEKLGIEYPQDNLMDIVQAEFEKYCEYERNGSIEKIEQKEMLRDAKGKAIAKLLNRIVPAGQFFNPMAAFWASLVNANLMVENGITGAALEMTWGFFMGVIAYKNDFQCGDMLAKKAMHIVEKEGFYGELYRMYHINGLARCHWFEPVEQDIYFAHEAYKGNLQNGEFEFSCFSFFTSQVAIFECCNLVAEMQLEVEAALSFANKIGNLYAIESFVSFRQLIKALKGETLQYGSFNSENFDEEKHVGEIQHNAIGLSFYYIYRALSAVLFGNYQKALTLTEKAVPLIPFYASFYTSALIRFLHSISICKTIAGMKDTANKQKLYKVLEDNQEWLQQRAQDAPFNFLHLYDLVDAEIKALERKYDESFRLYEKAILGAKENNRPYHYALACELAGQRYLEMGISRIAGFYLKEAYAAFLAWEAPGKTEAMKEKYPDILFSSMHSRESVQNTSDTTTFLESLDLNAIIKATQTISGEIETKKLLEKLMKIIIENSGSNGGNILFIDENSWTLSAYEIVSGVVEIFIDEQEIDFQSTYSKSILPLSIINFVIRTKEPVIIGNIPNSQFSSDNYFSGKTVLSVMCFPIQSQNILKGIVYLENDLLTEAFSQERLKVLNIFASQAAISLENAMLYADLEKKVIARTKELKEALEKLLQSDKMASLGTMVAGVAHEINNPINYIYLSSKVLEKDLSAFKKELIEIITGNEDEIIHYFEDNFVRFQHSLNNIIDGSNRTKTVVQDLRTFSRLDEAEKKEVSLAEALELTVRLVKTQYKQVEFVTDFKTKGNIECYPEQLNQVFLNIIVNSSQAILKKQKDSGSMGRVRISLEDNGKEIVTTIEDNGCGMSEEVKKRIFEPFFTTKPVGQGTGLGMSISYGIIEKHNGKIEVESQSGKGTNVIIFLPYIINSAQKYYY
ncbi:MAG: protein kinase domain-containing protein [Desulfitobacteriaceae bacterium]